MKENVDEQGKYNDLNTLFSHFETLVNFIT